MVFINPVFLILYIFISFLYEGAVFLLKGEVIYFDNMLMEDKLYITRRVDETSDNAKGEVLGIGSICS